MSKLPNVIFLDMDGVICTPRACVAMGNVGGGYSYLDPIACRLVKLLCEECDAKIVISSAWRQMYDKYAIQAILNANCPNLGNYVWSDSKWWRTTSMAWEEGVSNTSDRGREVRNWIENNETEFNNFVVLDDMSDMRPVQASLVKCDVYNGMGLMEYEAAKRRLQEEAQ